MVNVTRKWIKESDRIKRRNRYSGKVCLPCKNHGMNSKIAEDGKCSVCGYRPDHAGNMWSSKSQYMG